METFCITRQCFSFSKKLDFRNSTMMTRAIFICTVGFASLPASASAGKFGPPDGERRILPPLELFGKFAEALDHSGRGPASEKMAAAGIFDPDPDDPNQRSYEVNVVYVGEDVNVVRGEFLLSTLKDEVEANEWHKRIYESRKKFNDGSVTDIMERDGYRYFVEERDHPVQSLYAVHVVFHNLRFDYLSIGVKNRKEMAEGFMERYITFLKEKIGESPRSSEPAIPERTWTSSTGQELKGVVLSYDASNNTIDFKRFDGKTYPGMSLDLLSPEDQALIREKLGRHDLQ